MSMIAHSYPLVTIGIPTYNRAQGYLKEALESALAQTYPNIEIIVSDNCSPDNTEKVVKSYSDKRLRYIKQRQPIKPNDNFNFCLNEARGDYFLLLHDDDMVDSDFIATCMQAAEFKTDAGIIRTGTRIINARGRVVSEAPNRAAGLSIAEFFLGWFEGKTSFYICSTVFNTKKLKKIGGFGSRHNLFQDDVAGVTLAAQFGRVEVQDVKASYRVHSAELSNAAKVGHWCEDSIDLLQLMCELTPDKRDEVRRRGMRFFATINYSRASNIRPLGKRISAFLLVFKLFGYRYLPPFWLVFTSTALYRGLRQLKRRIMGLPEWIG